MLRRGLLKISPFIATVFPPLLVKAAEKRDAPVKDFNYGMRKVGLIGGIGPESTIPWNCLRRTETIAEQSFPETYR